MKIKDALRILQKCNPEAILCVGMEMDEDLQPGQVKTFLNVTGFEKVSLDRTTYIDTGELKEKDDFVVEVKI